MWCDLTSTSHYRLPSRESRKEGRKGDRKEGRYWGRQRKEDIKGRRGKKEERKEGRKAERKEYTVY